MSLFRDAGDNKKYTDRYKLFKRTDEQSYELRELTPAGEFRACDVVDFYEDEQDLNGVSLTRRKHLTIQTPSRLDFNCGDLIKSIKDDVDWVIRKVTIKDDNRSKDKSLRPKKVTILELWS